MIFFNQFSQVAGNVIIRTEKLYGFEQNQSSGESTHPPPPEFEREYPNTTQMKRRCRIDPTSCNTND